METSHRGKRWGVVATQGPASSSEQESGADEAERDPALVEGGGEATILTSRRESCRGEGDVKVEDGLDVIALCLPGLIQRRVFLRSAASRRDSCTR